MFRAWTTEAIGSFKRADGAFINARAPRRVSRSRGYHPHLMDLFPKRTLIGVFVVAFWLVMTAWLIRREAVPAPPAMPLGTTERTVDAWMGLFLDSNRVGTLHWRQAPEPREGQPGTALVIRSALTLNVLGKATELAVHGDAWRPDGVEGGEFQLDVRSGEHQLAVEGSLADGVLRTAVESAGETLHWSKAVEGTWIESSGFGSPLVLPPLEVGEQVQIASFDPLTLQPQVAHARCVGQERLTIAGLPRDTRVVELRSGGLESRAWIDETGMVLRAETPLGLAFEIIDPDPGAWTRADESDVDAEIGEGFLERTAVRPTGARPFRGAHTMVFDVRGAETDLPNDVRQTRLEPGRYRVTAVTEPPVAGQSPDPVPLDNEATQEPYLASDSLVQADHPRILAQAQSIIGETTQPWDQALRIQEWVYANIAKEAAMSIPSALEVLRTRRGDCNEHTVLFTALARSIGLPTRMAIGVVWSADLDGFYYHAWPEVHVGGWVPMDPTLGQTFADATHIKLLEGGLTEWTALLPFLGQLAIDIVEIE